MDGNPADFGQFCRVRPGATRRSRSPWAAAARTTGGRGPACPGGTRASPPARPRRCRRSRGSSAASASSTLYSAVSARRRPGGRGRRLGCGARARADAPPPRAHRRSGSSSKGSSSSGLAARAWSRRRAAARRSVRGTPAEADRLLVIHEREPRRRQPDPARNRATSCRRPPGRRQGHPRERGTVGRGLHLGQLGGTRVAPDGTERLALGAFHLRRDRRPGGVSGQGALGLRRQEDPCGKGYSPLTTLAVSGSALTVRFLPSRLAT